MAQIHWASMKRCKISQTFFDGDLGVCCVQCGCDGNLVLRSRSDVEGSLSHDWHVKMVDDCDLE